MSKKKAQAKNTNNASTSDKVDTRPNETNSTETQEFDNNSTNAANALDQLVRFIVESNSLISKEVYSAMACILLQSKAFKHAASMLEVIDESYDNNDLFYLIGSFYESGLNGKRDYSMACSYYSKAASRGHVKAAFDVGRFHQYGLGGITKDYNKAFKFYAIAAAEDHPKALDNLSHLYEYGKGVKKDSEKAFESCKKSAELGNEISWETLSRYYLEGIGTEVDFGLALQSLHKARKGGVHVPKAKMSYLQQLVRLEDSMRKDKIQMDRIMASYLEKANKLLVTTDEAKKSLDTYKKPRAVIRVTTAVKDLST